MLLLVIDILRNKVFKTFSVENYVLFMSLVFGVPDLKFMYLSSI